MRDHDAHRAGIQRAEHEGFRKLRNPHDRSDVGGARGEDHQVGDAAVERGMLLVDDDEIVADRSEDLDDLRRRQLEESPDQPLPGQESLT